MSAEAAVVMDGVVKRFGPGPPALDGVGAAIRHGEITGLIGPDGAGKTTLIRIMTGLMLPDAGTMTVLGRDTRAEAPAIQAEIGYMPQRFGLYEDLTVGENLELYADLQGVPPLSRARRFDELLSFTDLGPFTGRLAGKLSGGMKQKLGLACALMRRPRLLLLDEPSVGVDPISRRELWKMVERLAGDGVGVVWSTSYLDEAEACARVLLLNGGKLLFAGGPREATSRVDGRVFLLSGDSDRKRTILKTLLDDPDIADGTIQGDALRLVTRSGAPPCRLPEGATLSRTEARFEDAFVDMLGGGPGGRSRLADVNRTFPREGAPPVIEARGLTRRFGDFTAVSDIAFAVRPGEIFGLLGPNGAGKSTTFKMLCGLLKPSSGDGRVAGRDLRRDGAEARNRLGYMAQKFSLYGDLSVRQNLDFFAGVYGLSRTERHGKTALMLSIFDLDSHAGRPAGELPLGLRQRLSLACSVMHEPEALFLDEPTSGVDPVARRGFWAHINGLVEKGVGVLVTTHFMDEAEYCDRIALIYRGRAIALDTPDRLKAAVKSALTPNPTLEDAFTALIRREDGREGAP